MALTLKNIRTIIREKYAPDFEFVINDSSPWTPFTKELNDCKFALITTGGIHRGDDEPFDTESPYGDHTYREIPNDDQQSSLQFHTPITTTAPSMKT